VTEFKAAAAKLSPEDRWELYRWLSESKDVQRFQHDDLRREIALGLEQADLGNLAPMDIAAVKRDLRRRLPTGGR